MDELETRETIKLFHDVNLIMHFDAPNLRDIVIIDPKPAVLNKLSRLISVSFLNQKFLADRYKIVLPFEANELLQYRGRFSRDTLEKCAKFTEPITLQSLPWHPGVRQDSCCDQQTIRVFHAGPKKIWKSTVKRNNNNGLAPAHVL